MRKTAMKTEPITILSTRTDDILVDQNGVVLRTQAAGPALFITNALRAEGVEYACKTGNRLTVEILVTDEGEFGRVTTKPQPRAVPVDVADWTIVSTVLNEWDLAGSTGRLPGHLCVDVQGYVRDGRQFGRKQVWNAIEQVADKIFCLKGTAEEIALLPAVVVERQKQRLLIVTAGEAGIDVYDRGRYQHLEVAVVRGLKDTIGAGDTFFGCFVAGLYQGLSAPAAAEVAARKTTLFLQRKNSLATA